MATRNFPVRGVLLDVSRGKVPRMATLRRLVDVLARLDYNHLELYFEHAFAYRGHAEVRRNFRAYTAAEMRTLDRSCAARGIELVPCQNSLGHMERWLEEPRYRTLAERPQGGAPLPWGGTRAWPSALSLSDPRVFDLLAELYAQLLPNFSSRQFNACCDEVFDLSPGSRSWQSEQQAHELYLSFLRRVQRLARAQGKTRLLFWADMLDRHPECLAGFPRGATALEWGYEADHPFAERCANFARAKIPFWVSPGTSTWRSIAGRTTNMKANILSAVRAGREFGARGFLLTDWGDEGHWQPQEASFPAFVFGALAMRDPDAAATADLAAATAEVCGWPRARAQAWLDLGDIYLESGVELSNATALFNLLKGIGTVAIARQKLRKIGEMLDAFSDCGSSSLRVARDLLRAAVAKGLDEKDAARRLKRALELRRRIWERDNRSPFTAP